MKLKLSNGCSIPMRVNQQFHWGEFKKGLQSKDLEVSNQLIKGISRTTINHILTNPIYCAADELLYEFYQKKLIEFVNESTLWKGKYSACIVGKNGRSLRDEDLSGIMVQNRVVTQYS